MGDDAEAESEREATSEFGMYAVTDSGLTVGCENFKAIDGGVLLFADAKRKRVTGFVPHAELKYVLPADATTREGESAWEATASPGPITAETGSATESTRDAPVSAATDSAANADAEGASDGFRSELTVLGGLGETYARRLHEGGIDSLSAMRRADAARVATAAGVAESRANRWKEAANERDGGDGAASSERQAHAETSTEDGTFGAASDDGDDA